MYNYKCGGCKLNFTAVSKRRVLNRNEYCIMCHVSVIKHTDIEQQISNYIRTSDIVLCKRCNSEVTDSQISCNLCECTDIYHNEY